MDIQSLIDRIHADARLGRMQVPSMPDIAVQVRKAIQDPRKNNADIAKIVQMDPVLTARLIQISNSAVYRGKTPIKDCLGAVTRLGLSVTRNFIVSFTMRQMYAVKHVKLRKRLTGIWRHSCEVAAVSFVLAGTENALQADRAMLAGLLHDIGILPLLHYLAGYPDLIDDDHTFDQLVDQLRVRLGVFLLSMWKFDEEMIEAVRHAENYERNNPAQADYADVVLIAHLLATMTRDEDKMLSPQRIPALAKFTFANLGPHAYLELLDNARDEIDSVIHMLA